MQNARRLSFTRTRLAAAVTAVIVALPVGTAAQVLSLSRQCGMPGDSLGVGGSGWAEPDPVCEYLFLFNGSEFAPRQPDGLFGPPSAGALVPAVAPGDYNVRVELRLTSDGSLLQCRQTPFKVVAANSDPWAGLSTGGGGINLSFDPKDVCSVSPCTKIVFIQSILQTGTDATGAVQNLSGVDIGLPNGAAIDADLTPAGVVVDYILGEADPYYNGDDAADPGQAGVQGPTTMPATTGDTPHVPDSNFPTGIDTITMDFEVAAFCAQGHDKGQYFGTTRWRWQKTKGGTPTVTSLGNSLDPPSQGFLDALNLWATNHKFKLPTPGGQPGTGGGPCK